MKKIPRKLVFLLFGLAFVIVVLSAFYITTYINTRIDVAEEFGVTENVNSFYYTKLKKYDLTVVCNEYDISNDYTASYTVSITEATFSDSLVNSRFTVRVALAANWISEDAFVYSSSGSITLGGTTSRTLSVSNLDVFTTRYSILVPFPKPSLYVLVQYTLEEDGEEVTYNDIIRYKYGDYKVLTGGYE